MIIVLSIIPSDALPSNLSVVSGAEERVGVRGLRPYRELDGSVRGSHFTALFVK